MKPQILFILNFRLVLLVAIILQRRRPQMKVLFDKNSHSSSLCIAQAYNFVRYSHFSSLQNYEIKGNAFNSCLTGTTVLTDAHQHALYALHSTDRSPKSQIIHIQRQDYLPSFQFQPNPMKWTQWKDKYMDYEPYILCKGLVLATLTLLFCYLGKPVLTTISIKSSSQFPYIIVQKAPKEKNYPIKLLVYEV